MNNNVAHTKGTCPSKSVQAGDRIRYTAGTIDDLLADASGHLNEMAAAFMRVSGCIDLGDLNPMVGYNPQTDIQAFPTALSKAAGAIQASGLELGEIRELARGEDEDESAPASAPRASTDAPNSQDRTLELALDDLGNIVPLRMAVDGVVENVDGIVRECRAALDKAAAMHVYIAGAAGQECGFYPASENPNGDFNEHMAEAVGALKCLLTYIDQLRPEELRRKRGELAAQAIENDIATAAE